MTTKTKKMLNNLAERAENGKPGTRNFLNKLNLEKLKQPRVLWTAAGIAAVIGAGVAWRLMRNKTTTTAH